MAIRSIISLAAAAMLTGCGSGAAERTAAPVEEAARVEHDSAGKSAAAVVKTDVPYVPTPQEAVDEMLRMAKVSREDLVYDLGSGDGRIVITAAKEYGARGVGIDIDPQRIREANQNARAAGVADRVEFIRGNLFETDLRGATVVTLYLFPRINIELRPKLLAELQPGTPVVSHDFDMGEWAPDDQKEVGGGRLYLWIIPAQVAGSWSWTTPDGQRRTAVLRQEFQKLDGRVTGGGGSLALTSGRVNGEEITFELTRGGTGDTPLVERYRGRVNGRTITGTAEAGDRRWNWLAQQDETVVMQRARPSAPVPITAQPTAFDVREPKENIATPLHRIYPTSADSPGTAPGPPRAPRARRASAGGERSGPRERSGS